MEERVRKTVRIYKALIFLSSFFMLGFFLLLPKGIIGGNAYKAAVALIGVGLAAGTFFLPCSEAKSFIQGLNRLVLPYAVCVLISVGYSCIKYRYSLHDAVMALLPYLFVAFAYPLTVIFVSEDGCVGIVRRIAALATAYLILRLAVWILFNFFGVTMFEQMLLEFGEWLRLGFQRIYSGYLFGIAFAYYLAQFFIGEKRIKNAVVVLFYLLYAAIVSAFRFQVLAMLVTIAACFYLSQLSRRLKLCVTLIICAILLLPPGMRLIASFIHSFDPNNGTPERFSSQVRIDGAKHFLGLLRTEKPLLGLGQLVPQNENAKKLLKPFQDKGRFFLEDFGLFGGIAGFGILSIGVYFFLFRRAVVLLLKRKLLDPKARCFLIGLVTYMLFSCLLLNIFDLQRAFDCPFYFAIISFYYVKLQAAPQAGKQSSVSAEETLS